jgi:hypothetical protein
LVASDMTVREALRFQHKRLGEAVCLLAEIGRGGRDGIDVLKRDLANIEVTMRTLAFIEKLDIEEAKLSLEYGPKVR